MGGALSDKRNKNGVVDRGVRAVWTRSPEPICRLCGQACGGLAHTFLPLDQIPRTKQADSAFVGVARYVFVKQKLSRLAALGAASGSPLAPFGGLMARPRLDTADARTHIVGVRLTADELAAVTAGAEVCGVKVSEYIRRAALAPRSLISAERTDALRALMLALTRAGTNLRPLARAAQAGAGVPTGPAMAALTQLSQALDQVVGELGGEP